MKEKLTTLLASPWFFYAVLAFFGLSAVWVATASLYPMAFDEDFHLGLIKIYASSWLPYGIQHTSDMAKFGTATSDPSYLFHYLLSFPYRILHGIGFSETTIVISLRLINVAIALLAVYFYRLMLRALTLSSAATNVVLAFFVLIPIMPLVAGQINYDNPLLLVTAIASLLAIRISKSIQTVKILPVRDFALLVIVCLAGSATKYAFLPIAAGIVLWLVVLVWRQKKLQKIWRYFIADMTKMKRWQLALLVIGIVAGLFFNAKYIINEVEYGSAIPSCDKVFERKDCYSYGPYGRDERYKASIPTDFKPVSYPAYMATEWIGGMTSRLFFTLAGPTNGFSTRDPLPIIFWTYIVVTASGVLAFFVTARHILKAQPIWWMTIFMTLLYLVPLSITLYSSYVATGRPVAINGRYMLPLLPLLGGLFIVALMRLNHLPQKKLSINSIVAVILLLIITQGGGAGTYIVRGDSEWFWPGWGQESHAVFKSIAKPIVIE